MGDKWEGKQKTRQRGRQERGTVTGNQTDREEETRSQGRLRQEKHCQRVTNRI
jgi:hypothetical protein